jgi:hypothetical protein
MVTPSIAAIAERYVAASNQPYELSLLHDAIANKLPDNQRVEASAPIIDAMIGTQGPEALGPLSGLLQSMWREDLQCHPNKASLCALAGRATSELAQQVAKSSDQESDYQSALEILAMRIGPDQAPGVVALLQKQRAAAESGSRFERALHLAFGRLSPRDARNQFPSIFDNLAAKEPPPWATHEALATVTARLADDQMPGVLADVLRQYSQSGDKAQLAQAVTTTLRAAEGALESRQGDNRPVLASIRSLLSRAAYLVNQAEAATTPGTTDKAWTSSAARVLPALQAVLDGLAGPERPQDPGTLDPLVNGLSTPNPDPHDLQAIVEAIPAVASRLSLDQAARLRGSLHSIIGWTSNVAIAAPAVAAFRSLAAPLPAPARTESILTLLKYPGVEQVTSALLEGQQLEVAAGSSDSNLQLQEYLQALDRQSASGSANISEMPRCPAPYRSGLSCR